MSIRSASLRFFVLLQLMLFFVAPGQAQPLQIIGHDPMVGPICAGPLGPGPCADVQRWIIENQWMQPQPLSDLQQIGFDPMVGPICAGPLGPGPCAAVENYLRMLNGQMAPPMFDPGQLQIIDPGSPGGPTCNGPFGPAPCELVQQALIDSPGQFDAGLGSLSNLDGRDMQEVALICAERAGLNVADFASCTGGKAILPDKAQDVLDCATSAQTDRDFAECAAPKFGIELSEEQRIIADCAMYSNGASDDFVDCAGSAAADRLLTPETRAILECGVSASEVDDVLDCASGELTSGLSGDERILAECALQSSGGASGLFSCVGSGILGDRLGNDERAILNCAADANDTEDFAGCAATSLIGSRVSKEQRIAIQCAAESGGDATMMATCAGANFMNLDLNPEQQIAVQCVVSTGGQPYAAAGCMATRLTARELTKCFTDGFGGDGCFGDNNDLVGRNGWVGRSLGEIAGGPNSLINNPDQIWGGDNSFIRNPDQIWGGDNSFINNPDQIWGGDNSVFNNPSQLAPEPVELGEVGGHRVCLPWC